MEGLPDSFSSPNLLSRVGSIGAGAEARSLPAGVVYPRENTDPIEGKMIEHCRGLIAGYKCPKRVDFQKDPLPKSGPGKILKTELRKPYWEGKTRQVN